MRRGMLRSSKNKNLTRCIAILSVHDRRKLLQIIITQVALALLDLVGVLLIGILGTLAVTSVGSTTKSGIVWEILNWLRIEDFSFHAQLAILGTLAISSLVGRTLLSILFTRRTLYFLSHKGAQISANLVSKLLLQPMLKVQEKSIQETIFVLTTGVMIITLQVLAPVVTIISDLALLIVLGIGLFAVDPTTSLGTLIVFIGVGFLLYRIMHTRANTLGMEFTRLNVRSNDKISEVFNSYRESVVRNRRSYYAREIGKIRSQLAETQAEINCMPFVSKYVIETVIILGSLILGAVQFFFQDATQAVGTLAIFLAAGSRIAPAVLRVQQGLVQISNSIGQASPTLDLIEMLNADLEALDSEDTICTEHEGFSGSIQLRDVSYRYPNRNMPALFDVDLEINSGDVVAIVGPSGSGKTTLIDIVLGILPPSNGLVRVAGEEPMKAIKRWPGAVSYVPQDIKISAGTILENVILGYPIEEIDLSLVDHALEVAQLTAFVNKLEDGVNTNVGEGGSALSGGQRQRLGIARAMLTKPKLVVLDEATSALDGETEAAFSAALNLMRGETTIIMIAHRLTTVANADQVIYLEEGKIRAKGTFLEVQRIVPGFANQSLLQRSSADDELNNQENREKR